MSKKKKPLSDEIGKKDLEIARAQQMVFHLQRERLQLLRAELTNRQISVEKLEELSAADGEKFTLTDPSKQPGIYAKAANGEEAYHCPGCGWVKGAPETSKHKQDGEVVVTTTCFYCEGIVESHSE